MNGIGIDIGTTAIKALLFSKEGNVLYESSQHVETLIPQRNYKEQDPHAILTAVIYVLSDISAYAKENQTNIDFVSFSAYMHSLIAVDKNGEPLTNCLLWSDNRSEEFAEHYRKNQKGIEIYAKTGTPVHPMSPFYKILFLRETQNEIFQKTHKFISIKGYIFYKFFNVYAVDYSIASATGIFDIFALDWNSLALQELQLVPENFSACYDSTHFFENMQAEYAAKTKLPSNIKFVLGASDGCLANLGSRGIEENVGVVSIGTSGAVRVTAPEPVIDSHGRTFSYLLKKGFYVSGGAINNGGIVYEWFNNTFVRDSSKMEKLLSASQEGAGPLFLPFLSGERAPYWDSNLRGIYFGIDSLHQEKDFLRASMEGVCYAIADVYAVLKDVAGEVSVFYANGGFTRSDIWVQTLANVLQKKIVVSENYQAPALGAYMLGMLALKKYSSFREMNFLLQDGKEFLPQKEKQELHQKRLSLYQKLISVNKELFKEME